MISSFSVSCRVIFLMLYAPIMTSICLIYLIYIYMYKFYNIAATEIYWVLDYIYPVAAMRNKWKHAPWYRSWRGNCRNFLCLVALVLWKEKDDQRLSWTFQRTKEMFPRVYSFKATTLGRENCGSIYEKRNLTLHWKHQSHPVKAGKGLTHEKPIL